jgi:hypothetical protein
MSSASGGTSTTRPRSPSCVRTTRARANSKTCSYALWSAVPRHSRMAMVASSASSRTVPAARPASPRRATTRGGLPSDSSVRARQHGPASECKPSPQRLPARTAAGVGSACASVSVCVRMSARAVRWCSTATQMPRSTCCGPGRPLRRERSPLRQTSPEQPPACSRGEHVTSFAPHRRQPPLLVCPIHCAVG